MTEPSCPGVAGSRCRQVNNVTAIAAGRYHSLALLADGTTVSWGNDSYRGDNSSRPVGRDGNRGRRPSIPGLGQYEHRGRLGHRFLRRVAGSLNLDRCDRHRRRRLAFDRPDRGGCPRVHRGLAGPRNRRRSRILVPVRGGDGRHLCYGGLAARWTHSYVRWAARRPPTKAGSFTFAVTATGDLTSRAVFTSDWASDIIDGATVRFTHASVHTITGTLGGLTSTVAIQLSDPVGVAAALAALERAAALAAAEQAEAAAAAAAAAASAAWAQAAGSAPALPSAGANILPGLIVRVLSLLAGLMLWMRQRVLA
ncbi:hypothetical protein E3T51_13340 [Cryobacterium serini]|uniref:Uncharacterized protein n=1 Tax=Cryobacterium serini TaxID=1259201 RepID=A0A4R9BM48_9MICO|nr:hypothetical protein E3T51_13340 [Cryobacterium serini]